MTHSLWLHANHQWAFVWIYYLLSKNKCRVNCSMVKSMSPGDSLVICVVYSLIHLLFSTSHLYTYWTTNNNNNDSHIATLWITLSLLDIETMNTSGIDELCLQLCPCPLPGRRWTTKGDRDRDKERERERKKVWQNCKRTSSEAFEVEKSCPFNYFSAHLTLLVMSLEPEMSFGLRTRRERTSRTRS